MNGPKIRPFGRGPVYWADRFRGIPGLISRRVSLHLDASKGLILTHSETSGHAKPESFIWKYIFSVDHKVVGIQYGLTAMFFLLAGFAMMLMMRWQLAYPGLPIPVVGQWAGPESDFLPDGTMVPETYNSLGAMHGTVMIFLAVVPFLVGAFGNYLVPLMVGAPDMAFPRLNMLSYWVYFVGGLIMLSSFVIPEGGAPNSGWTSYPPLAVTALGGQTIWLIAMIAIITSSLLGSINIIVTIIQLRAEGMTFFRLPFFVWTQFVAAFLLVMAFPPLEAAGVLMLMDRVAGTSFFMPSGLVLSGEPLEIAGGGSALLWQHLFWFLGHPEVYVLILPALGIVAEIIANNTRRPLWGYRPMVYSVLTVGFLSFIVWAHHMYLTGMGTTISAFFETTTMIISIPSIVILTALVGTLWGGSIRFNVPMWFAIAFIPMFGIGGLTGLPLGLAASDIHLHDTMYIIGHFHYIVAPGTIFAIFAGVYFWFPKITGRKMSEWLGHLHFWPSLIFMNGIFMPMFIQGMAGVNRRLYDGGVNYAHAQDVLVWNKAMTHSAFGLAIAQLPFLINFALSIRWGAKVDRNPWQATTLEWMAPSPPMGHGNFETEPVVCRGPYEYSVPGAAEDFSPQFQTERA